MEKWRTERCIDNIKNAIIIIFPVFLICILFGLFHILNTKKNANDVLLKKTEKLGQSNKEQTNGEWCQSTNSMTFQSQQTGADQENHLIQLDILKNHFVDLKDYFSLELISSGEKRDCYIDFIRGLAALSIVYIHTCFWSGTSYIPEWWYNAALLFDVPVFFLSGWNINGTQQKIFGIGSGI